MIKKPLQLALALGLTSFLFASCASTSSNLVSDAPEVKSTVKGKSITVRIGGLNCVKKVVCSCVRSQNYGEKGLLG